MAREIEGFKFSYDYDELLKSINEDIEDGLISDSSIIKIVRGEEMKLTAGSVYRPIIDYYLPIDLELLTKPLEALENREEYTESEWNEMEEEHRERLELYQMDEPNLEAITVLALKTEMNIWNEII